MSEVIVLFEGYSNKLDKERMEANCSCVLIKGPKTVIVDTMTAWDKDRIIDALARHDVEPEDIDFVVCTHGHADHIGNNNLFLKAEHIVGSCVHKGSIFYEKHLQGAEHQLCEGVKVLRTPGHTYDDVSVIVESTVDAEKVTIAVAGDLFEKEADLENPEMWQNLGVPELRKTQAENRFLVIMLADYIVPGHGKMFKVTEKMRRLAEYQIPVDLNESTHAWRNSTIG
ncbi:metallo-beta-lactamase domain-containing protein 1 [Diachasma alloeum]|uniref:metallo-beta-lactamase domain-containing protein 1 n=1 Tax=Diachasma alloeum TaxID=454923 RepID=UPI00073813EE|nr:metallo-beta-lactamase domain-containing protein 1 [Diachasma alloeum]